MGLFGIFKKEKKEPDLLRSLLDAKTEKDRRDLCIKDKDSILRDFKSWSTVPEQYRNNKALLNWYGQGLIGVAVCMNAIGEPGCLAHLQGADLRDENPMMKIEQQYGTAHNFSQSGDYELAIKLLKEILDIMAPLKGSGVDKYKPRSLGLIGTCYYHLGDKVNAEKYCRDACDYCLLIDDQEGAKVHLENLRILRTGS